MSKRIISSLLTLFILLSFIAPASGGGKLKEKKVPRSLSAEFKYLTKFITDSGNRDFDVNSITNILDFVVSKKSNSSLYYMDKWKRSTAAYSEFNIKSDLSRLIQYAFNPHIPAYAIRPSSLRNSRWTEIEGEGNSLPKLWEILDNIDKPFVVRGVEHEEITPDTNTGTYYGYDMKRVLILGRYKGGKLLLSLSMQPEKSEVGKKGAVLGVDKDWNYFYSGLKGVTKKGLGWASAYMYRALSISIYYETGPAETPVVKCATFKWLRAGWAGFNMVNRNHIVNGIKRYARDFKFIIEHPDLPEPDELAKMFLSINNLSHDDLKKEASNYVEMMLNEYGDGDILSRREFSKLFSKGAYVGKMEKQELQNMLAIQKMKSILGKGYKGTLFLEQP